MDRDFIPPELFNFFPTEGSFVGQRNKWLSDRAISGEWTKEGKKKNFSTKLFKFISYPVIHSLDKINAAI